MNRLKKVAYNSYDFIAETVTFPIKVSIGIVKAVSKHKPDKLDFPVSIEFKNDNKKKPEHKPKEV